MRDRGISLLRIGAVAMVLGCGGKSAKPYHPTNFSDGLPAGNPDGKCAVPDEARAEDTSKPDHVVGNGTAASCTGDAVVAAVAKGGIITFDCGPNPITIVLGETAKIVNDTGPKIVIDGGGKVALSGGGKVRILYMNTCDEAQKYTTSHCDDQDSPQLTVQNITFVDGKQQGETNDDGGGAIFALGGRFKAVNARFFGNVCSATGSDVGGAAIRVFEQSMGKPAYIVNCTFGGSAELGNVGSNGGAISSIGVSYTVLNTLMSYNEAIGPGGTPGGGNGGAIYNDGDMYTLTVCGTLLEHNSATEGGGAIFYVSNDHSGTLSIADSTLRDNPSAGFETAGYPGVFVQAKSIQVTGSTLMP